VREVLVLPGAVAASAASAGDPSATPRGPLAEAAR
jgi:hypothetical protein